MSNMEVFLTPDAPNPGRGTRTEIDKGKEKGEKRPRNRDSDLESDSDSVRSDASIFTDKLRKKLKEDKHNKSVKEINEIKEIKIVEVGDEKEESILEAIRDLEKLIRKTKYSTREIRVFATDPDNGIKNVIRLHAGQADRQLEAIATKLKNIELRLELDNLRQSLQMRDIGTQSSPCLRMRGYESEDRGMEGKNIGKKGIGKNKKQNEGKRVQESHTGETEEEGTDRGKILKVVNSEVPESEKSDLEKWTVVDKNKKEMERRQASKKKKEEEEAARRKREETKERAKKDKIPRTEAIVVKATESRTFADLFKKLKNEAGGKMDGIQTVRKSRGGDLIIEMEKDVNGGGLEKVVRETLGEDHRVRRMTPKVTFEIRDVDPTLEREEVIREIARELKIETGEIDIKTIRFGYGGTKTVIINLPAKTTEGIEGMEKIRVGFTKCRIRRTQNLIRCFRCHDFGHMSYTCKVELQGRELCRRCGGLDHQINGCQAIRCCVLCTREGISASKAEHIAGAANCPQYKKYLQQLAGGSSKSSI